MKRIEATDAQAQSADIVADNLSQLKRLFPEAFAEGKVQFDTLRQLLGVAIDGSDEKYGLNWHGKRRARQIALMPSTGTLRPCPDESVNWDTTQNLMIEGDNLEVLKLLQKSYAGKVKLIYIDPPYNTGKDFVYPDNFRDSIGNYLELTGQSEGGAKLSANTESSGRYHTDWLNMIYPRLKLARSLLRDDGIIAISIDDNEIDRLRAVCAEIFGEENFVSQIVVQSNPRGRQSDNFLATVHEYVLIYARNAEVSKVGGAALTDEQRAEFSYRDSNGKAYRLLGLRQRGAASLREDRPDMYFPIYVNPTTLTASLDQAPGFTEKVLPRKSTGEDGRWMWGKDKCRRDIHLLVPRLIERRSEYDIFVVDFLEKGGEERSRKYKTIWDDKGFNNQNGTQEVKELLGCAASSFPKPVSLLSEVIQFGASDDDLILDFFAGSGTTGHAVMAKNVADGGNRRYILVQLPEPLDAANKEQKVAADFCDQLGRQRTIAEVTKERLRRSAAAVKKGNPMFSGDVGFRVFRLDKSNIREWTPDSENLSQTLLDHREHILEDRTEADIVYELLLKLGLDLCVPMESRAIAGKTVDAVGAGVLMLCLAEKIGADEVEALATGIAVWHKQLAPTGDSTVVFLDSAFTDDVAKTNMAAILAQNGLENVRSL